MVRAMLLAFVLASCAELAEDTVQYRMDGAVGSACGGKEDCDEGLECSDMRDVGYCTAECDEADPASCPEGSSCVEGRCTVPAGGIGAHCFYENDCVEGLYCENRFEGGYCTAECSPDLSCPAIGQSLCVKMSGDLGNFCLTLCESAADCASDLSCTPLTNAPEVKVCFP